MLEGEARAEDAGPSTEGPFRLHFFSAGAALPAETLPNGVAL